MAGTFPKLNISAKDLQNPNAAAAILNQFADSLAMQGGAANNVIGANQINTRTAGINATNAQNTANQAIAKTFQGAWSSTVSYAMGASVEYSGVLYVSLITNNLNNTPSSSPTDWLASGQASYAGVWSGATAYTLGQIVSVSSSLYIALQNSTNENPTSTTGYWQLLTGTSIYEGAWSSATAYSVGQTVSFTDGNFYICISPNTNQVPAPIGSTYWTLLGTSNTLIGAYSGATAYIAGNEVTYNGNIFQALQATTGNAPPTPPATSIYWQLMGPESTGVIAPIGSIPPTFNNGFTYTSTTTSITWAWGMITVYRANGTTATIAAGSQAITGLVTNTTYYFYPYCVDNGTSSLTLSWVNAGAVSTLPSVVGVTLNGSTAQVTTTSGITRPTTYTVEAWVHTTATSGTIAELNATSGSGAVSATYVASLQIGGGYAQFSTESGSTIGGNTGSNKLINDGEWHHVVALYNGTMGLIYVDGVQCVSAAASAPSGFTGYWRIGEGDEVGFLNGTVAHVAVYQTAELTATQITNHYSLMVQSGPSAYAAQVISDGATHYWKLIETSGTSAADSATSGTDTGTYQTGCTLNQSQTVISPIGSPAYAWVNATAQAVQAQSLQTVIPLSTGAMTAATPSTGSGGGSGGGSTGGTGGLCLSSATRILTSKGYFPICDVATGDVVQTSRGTWRRVTERHQHEYSGPMHKLPFDGLITPSHSVLSVSGKWKPARLSYPGWISYEGLVYNLSIEANDDGTTSDTEHSYTLAGNVICHNQTFQK